MKKIALIAFLFIGVVCTANAQPFLKGTNLVAAGIGFGGSLGSFSYGSQAPAISLQYERGVWEIGDNGVISLGGYVGRKSYKASGETGTYRYSQKWNYTVIGVRSAYHYTGLSNKNVDLYGGLMLAYNILNYKYEDNQTMGSPNMGSFGSSAGLSAYLGGRYFFSDILAGFAEAGYGVSFFTVGLAIKL